MNEVIIPNKYKEDNILPKINLNEKYYENIKRQISGIQFHKRFFLSMTSEEINHFLISFRGHIYKISEILSGNIQAAGNDVKIVNGSDGLKIIKFRNGNNRILTTYNDGTITLLRNSSHDRQSINIKKIKKNNIGLIYYPLSDFISQINLWLEKDIKPRTEFANTINNPMYYTYDDDQLDIMTQNEHVNNISVVGNAGAGKSIIGINWMLEMASIPSQKFLYLTMSENLVDMLKYRLNGVRKNTISIKTTSSFLKDKFQKFYPDIPGICLYNSSKSYQIFCEFWSDKITDKFISKAIKNKSITATLKKPEIKLMAWTDIHGIIKGGLPRQMNFQNLKSIPDYLKYNNFVDILRHEQRDRDSNWYNLLYKIFDVYQIYLKEHNFFDDNDIARKILKYDSNDLENYDNVFIDECQDLTQVELLALFYLLQNSKQTRLASDRCQVVQPTHFSEAWMRTTINQYDEFLGKKVISYHHRPFYLHYNYRSTKSIVDYQNEIIDYFKQQKNIHFKEEEVEYVCVPSFTPQGNKPIWIMGSEKNRHMIMKLFHNHIINGNLQVIVANNQSRSLKYINDYIIDVPKCKGMEYSSVLMFNILNDTCFDILQSLRYYYVGATRAYQNLLIYEDITENSRDSQNALLKEAYQKGVIDCCRDLNDISPYRGIHWRDYLTDIIESVEDTVKIDEAKSALISGKYQLAYKLFLRDKSVDKSLLSYCKAGIFISKGDNTDALNILYQIPKDWSYHGINRMTGARIMMRINNISKDEYIAAKILSITNVKSDFMEDLKESFMSCYGENDINQIYPAIYSSVCKYEYASECFNKWLDIIKERIKGHYNTMLSNINNLTHAHLK